MTPQQQRQIDRMMILQKITELCEKHKFDKPDDDPFVFGYNHGKAVLANEIQCIINGEDESC